MRTPTLTVTCQFCAATYATRVLAEADPADVGRIVIEAGRRGDFVSIHRSAIPKVSPCNCRDGDEGP